MDGLTGLIRGDMKPALGVTEPGAIAFAVAKAKEYTSGEPLKITVALNSGMYKNAFTCGIPGSDETGNRYAAALGYAAGDAALGLEALAKITEADNLEAGRLVEAGIVEVILDHMGSEITIDATIKTKENECTVRIAGSHTAIIEIICNGKTVLKKDPAKSIEKHQISIHDYSFHDIIQYVRDVEISELDFIRSAFTMNMELLETGLRSGKMTFGPQLLKENRGQLFSKDVLRTAQLLCNGAIEARVMGIDQPAMSITGSGAHGIIAVMPLYAYYRTRRHPGSV